VSRALGRGFCRAAAFSEGGGGCATEPMNWLVGLYSVVSTTSMGSTCRFPNESRACRFWRLLGASGVMNPTFRQSVFDATQNNSTRCGTLSLAATNSGVGFVGLGAGGRMSGLCSTFALRAPHFCGYHASRPNDPNLRYRIERAPRANRAPFFHTRHQTASRDFSFLNNNHFGGRLFDVDNRLFDDLHDLGFDGHLGHS
jgi:hypothetical protein